MIKKNPKLVFYCVNYKNYIEVINFVKKINSLKKSDQCEIVIVNNGDSAQFGKLEEGLLNISNVTIFHSDTNLGYINGMHKGYNLFQQQLFAKPTWSIACNTDISFESIDFIEKLLNADIDNETVVLAPKIISAATRKNQNPFAVKRPSKKLFLKWKRAYSNPLFFNIYIFLSDLKSKVKNSSISETVYIYAPHGSFFILKDTFFNLGGTLHYNGFLYGEEIYIGEQVLKMNKKIQYIEDLSIIHEEHTNTSLLKSDNLRRMKYESNELLYRYLYSLKEDIK